MYKQYAYTVHVCIHTCKTSNILIQLCQSCRQKYTIHESIFVYLTVVRNMVHINVY